MSSRFPVVAGAFYPSSKDLLIKEIEKCFKHQLGPGKVPDKPIEYFSRISFLISPHAGYVYSGPVAAHGYYNLYKNPLPKTIIILGPNHQGYGTSVSIYPEGTWRTPLGEVKIDKELAYSIARVSDVFSLDEASHMYEHSIEVQIPFLQYILKDFKIVPICMLDQNKKTSIEVGEAIASIIADKKDVAIIASTDFTHYESAKDANRKDNEAIKAIIDLDVDKFYNIIEELNVSMCGFGPVSSLMTIAKKIGVKKGNLLKYATSGDITGDYSSVVGYASIFFEAIKNNV
ncbi:MAG: AmmeMemoRadiSam system protein B [Nitrososphaerota archaeon]